MARMTHTGAVPQDLCPTVAATAEQRRIIFMAAALLLDYPNADLPSTNADSPRPALGSSYPNAGCSSSETSFSQKVGAVAAQLRELPAEFSREFGAFLLAAREMGVRGLQTHYVDTFDQRRRCSLYLTYYAVGDTRQRGAALVAFKEHLQFLGFELDRDELPDHLCVILEAAALAQDDLHDAAVELLAAHRDGIEVLRAALEHVSSPYAHLVRAVCMALPQVDQETADRYFTLITAGPPAEMVGLDTMPLPFPAMTGASS